MTTTQLHELAASDVGTTQGEGALEIRAPARAHLLHARAHENAWHTMARSRDGDGARGLRQHAAQR